MAKVKFPLKQVLEISAVDNGAMSDKHPRYKKLKKRFKKNLLAMDYEVDLEKKKKKKKKLKEELGLNEMAVPITTFKDEEHFDKWLKNAKWDTILTKGNKKNITGFNYEKAVKHFKAKKAFRYLTMAGQHWPEEAYNHKEIFELLVKKSGVREIALAGHLWPKGKFNYEKGLDELIKRDGTLDNILYAGAHWSEFNYEKGLDELIKRDKTGKYIYYAGEDWFKINHKKALDALKKISNEYYYDEALKEWPKGIKDVRTINKQLRDKSKKLPKKPLRLKETFEYKNIDLEMKDLSQSIKKTIEDGNRNGYSEKRITDFLLAYNNATELYHSVNSRFSSVTSNLMKDIEQSVIKVHKWSGFDREEALKIARKNMEQDTINYLIIPSWPMGIKGAKEETKRIRDTSKKLPKKTMKLEDALAQEQK